MIPEGWKQIQLELLANRIGDGIHATPEYDDDGAHYFINGNNIRDGAITVSETTKKVSLSQFEKHRLDLDDFTILMSINGTIGNLAMYRDEPVILGKSAAYIRIKKGVCKNFLFHVLASDKTQRYFESELTGTTIKNLSLRTIRSTPILLPNLSEQRRIAEILATWDRAIETVEALIANARAQKKALMQSLLTGKHRLPGFSGEWRTVRLGECAKSLDNRRVPINGEQRQSMQGNIPYYGANGVLDYINDYIFDEPIVLLAEDGGYFDEYKTRPIAQLITGKSWVNNHAHILSNKPNATIEWLFFSLVHRNIMDFINGGTRAKLNKSDMLKIPINLPDLDEQNAICTVLQSAEREIELVTNCRDFFAREKSALMQQLLTGKRRVKLLKKEQK
jgi:type I restriction enzyme, S subunit